MRAQEMQSVRRGQVQSVQPLRRGGVRRVQPLWALWRRGRGQQEVRRAASAGGGEVQSLCGCQVQSLCGGV